MKTTDGKKLLKLAIEGIENDDDGDFWDAAQPLLDAKGVTEAQISDAWLKATPEEGYNNTFQLLGLSVRVPVQG